MEAILALLALAIILLPVIALIVAFNTKSGLEKRIAALEREIRSLREEQSAAPAQSPTRTPATAAPAATPRGVAHHASTADQSPPLHPALPISAPGTIPGKPAITTGAHERDAEIIPQEHQAQEEQVHEQRGAEHRRDEQPAPQQQTQEPATTAPATAGRPSRRNRPAPPRVGAGDPAVPPPPPKPSRTKAEWEALLGGQVLNRIGAVAIIIGVGFFLKYAFDKQWITEEMRTGIGALTGVLLLLIGARSHRKGYEVFSQGLVGAGVSVLYLTVYAAFGLYDLGLSQTVAFLLMSAVTVLAFQQAFHYNSLAVSLLGLIGGFLTPVMLSTGAVNAPGLFTYLAILNAGIIAITIAKRQWKILEPIAFLSTYFYFFIWFGAEMTPEQSGVAAIFLGIFWALFQIPDILRTLRGTEDEPALLGFIGWTNGILLLSGMLAIAEESGTFPQSAAAAIIAAIYLAMMTFLRGTNRTATRSMHRNALIGIAAAALAVSVHPFPTPASFYRGLVMIPLALLFFWWGALRKQRSLWIPALLLFLNALHFAFATETAAPMVTIGIFPVLRVVFLLFLLGAALLVALIPARRIDGTGKRDISNILSYGWPVVLLMAISLLTMHTFIGQVSPASLAQQRGSAMMGWLSIDYGPITQQFPMLMILVLVWIACGLGLILLGVRFRRLPLLHCGIGIMAIATVLGVLRGASYLPLEEFRLGMNIRAFALLGIVAGTMLAARWLARDRDRGLLPRAVIGVLQICAVLVLLELLTVEAADAFNSTIQIEVNRSIAASNTLPDGRIADLRNWEQLTISGIWILYSAVLMVAGILRKFRPLRVMAFVLFGFTILKIFVYDLSFLDTLYRIFSFIGLGVILLGISFLFQRFRNLIFGDDTGGDTGNDNGDNGGIPAGSGPEGNRPSGEISKGREWEEAEEHQGEEEGDQRDRTGSR